VKKQLDRIENKETITQDWFDFRNMGSDEMCKLFSICVDTLML